MAGFTIIERTRPLTATPRGQAYLGRAAQVLALAPPSFGCGTAVRAAEA